MNSFPVLASTLSRMQTLSIAPRIDIPALERTIPVYNF
ncbi:hypothetical protein RHOER0001_5535 [Rhodococcus erythropolis SK121]|nr:hypothetical protein RHOER0001_5535 [Rhodococcus erythropolis SK121]